MNLVSKIISWFFSVFTKQKEKFETPIRRELRELNRLGQNLIVMEMGK